ncbi:MAG: hypothetical protein FWE40_07235 [Oscillospiraceae bacterium]|nr:hypothetical protein [Oscillospiraceae bacterium]
MKKILSILLTFALLGMGMINAVATTTPQQGWSVDSEVRIMRLMAQASADQLRLMFWTPFDNTATNARNGFDAQSRRATSAGGPTAFVHWRVYEVVRDAQNPTNYTLEPIEVHSFAALPDNQQPVRVFSSRVVGLREELHVRQNNAAPWSGELRIQLCVVALCTDTNTTNQIVNAPNFGFDSSANRLDTLMQFNTADTDYLDLLGRRLVRVSATSTQHIEALPLPEPPPTLWDVIRIFFVDVFLSQGFITLTSVVAAGIAGFLIIFFVR